jgi:SpoVK/Ycf46/Vps4 family AAA+-type ATPase
VDALFYLSLPKERERREIFRIHIEKRGRNVKKFDLDELAGASLDFTGSECEEAVVSAMYAAFDEGKEVATKHVVAACKATVPLARTMSEDIHKLEEWGKKHARPASSEETTKGDQFRRLAGGE